MLIELQYAPQRAHEHDQLDEKENDREEIQTRIQRAIDDDEANGDAVSSGAQHEIR